MEGKTVILSVLIMSLVMAQIQVEASACCDCFRVCRFAGTPTGICEEVCGCKCAAVYNNGILEITGDAVNKYCKVGCVSSVCGALITLQNSDASEIVNGAVGQCAKACSTICTKGSITEVEKTA